MPKKKNAKEKILIAAKKEFSEKGFIRSNIADIALKAGINNSAIYNHFKGKEDVLFSIPFEMMTEVLELVEINLKGIRDATSLISKLIWLQLNYGEIHPEHTRIILECRSQKNFYRSDSYELIRKFGGILQTILEKGVKDGVFRDNVNLNLVRDIIFGTVDFELLSGITTHEIDEPSSDLDQIMELILPMVVRKTAIGQEPENKADKILSAAEIIFAETGLAKAKLNDVAKLAGVADGTIYEYFKNKEAILMAISAKRLQQNMDRLEEAFVIKSPLRKLRRLIRYHFSLYLTNRNFLKVFLLDTQLSYRFYRSEAYQTFQRYYKVIENCIEEGKSEGVFRPNVNSRVFRNLFIGTFNHMALRWFIIGNDEKIDMMKEIDDATDLLSLAVLANKAAPQPE